MQQYKEPHNPELDLLVGIIDDDNGTGFHHNIPKKGQVFRFDENDSKTKILYELKIVDDIRVVFLRYIHYDNKSELLRIMAFACKVFKELSANMVYYREKDRDDPVGPFLEEIGFDSREIDKEYMEFDCSRDSWPCHCTTREYWVAGVK